MSLSLFLPLLLSVCLCSFLSLSLSFSLSLSVSLCLSLSLSVSLCLSLSLSVSLSLSFKPEEIVADGVRASDGSLDEEAAKGTVVVRLELETLRELQQIPVLMVTKCNGL